MANVTVNLSCFDSAALGDVRYSAVCFAFVGLLRNMRGFMPRSDISALHYTHFMTMQHL